MAEILSQLHTLKLTAISHLKDGGWDDDPFLLGFGLFSGAMLVSDRAPYFSFLACAKVFVLCTKIL